MSQQEPDIAKVGDLIILQRESSFLSIDGLGNIIWETTDGAKAPSSINRCIWRICQRLSYQEQEIAMHRRKSMNEDELQAVLDEASLEIKRNENDVAENTGSRVNFGRVIQLQSVFNNKYITAKSEVSSSNRDYLSLQLEDGSSASYFKIKPKYKIRSEGGQINYGDDILLSSMQQSGYYLNEQKFGKGSQIYSKSGYTFNNASLSKTTVDTSIKIALYARYNNSTDDVFLKAGRSFRLFDREVEGFLQAFCTIDKKQNNDDLLGALNPMDMKMPDMKMPDMKMPDMKVPDMKIPGIPNVMDQKKELTPFVSPKLDLHPDSFSPRMVFVIEPVDRKKGGLIEWNKPQYKIKHLSTGKYLTVGDVNLKKKQGALAFMDVANQMNAIAQAAAKAAADSAAAAAKGKGPVFDISIPREEELYTLTLEYESSKPEHGSRQIFEIKNVDKPQIHVPKQDVMIIITHVRDDNTTLTLHVNENRTVCMSSSQKSYDALLLVEVPEQNEQIVSFFASAVPILGSYCDEVECIDGAPKSASDLQLEKKILEDITLTSLSAISIVQNSARDQKILDLLMAVVTAPTNAGIELKLQSNGDEFVDSRFVPLAQVHELAWRAISFLVRDNRESEAYFVNIKVITKLKKEPVNYLKYFGFSYFESMTDLSKLSIPKMPDISNINLPGAMDINEMGNMGSLGSFQDMGNMKMEMPMSIGGVDPFGIMIGNDDPFASGPPKEEEKVPTPDSVDSPSLSIIINQISAPVGAAECMGQLIDNNPQLQAKIVDATMIDYFKRLILDEGPSQRFLNFFSATCMCQGVAITRNQELCLSQLVMSDDFDILTVKLKGYGQMDFASLDLLDFDPPEKFLGDSTYADKTFPNLAASWMGADDWSLGNPNLYYSANALGLQSDLIPEGCALEELLWVLEPVRLCPVIKNQNWVHYERGLKSDHQLLAQFQRQLKVAEYFLSQIELYGYMLAGRPSNIIAAFEKMFPYELLLSAVLNKKLASSVRAAFVTFISNLYVKRFPHEDNCGRLSIPSRMHVYTWLCMNSISDYGALPYFKLHSKSILLQSPNPIDYLNTPQKFYLLNKFIASYLSNINRQVVENKIENVMIKTVITLIRDLSNYGFYPTVNDILEVSKPLLRILDGRSDVEKSSCEDVRDFLYSGMAFDENEGTLPDERVVDCKRYKNGENSLHVIECKREAVKLMSSFVTFRLHFMLQRYLYLFRLYKDTNRNVTVEDLMEIIDDSSSLDISKLSDIPFESTLIDLMMYEDESLFEETFSLLCLQKSYIHLILENASQCTVMSHEKIPGFGTFEDIEGNGLDLRRLLSTVEVWGQITTFNDVVDVEKYKSVYSIIASLVKFLQITPVNQRQELLLQLNIHKTLFQVLSWDFSTKAPSNEKNSLSGLAKKALEVLKTIVSRNYKVQRAFVMFADLIMNQTHQFPFECFSLLVEIFKLHEDIVSRTPVQLFNSFGPMIGDEGVSVLARQFFYSQLALDRSQLDKGIMPRNQSLVINAIKNAISDNKYSLELSSISSESLFYSHVEVMEILGLCARQNREIRTKIIPGILKWEEVIERVRCVLNSGSNSSNHGLSIVSLSNEENSSQIRRSRFLASGINFLNWVNLSKGFDAKQIQDGAIISISREICNSIVSDKTFSSLLTAKNMLVRTATEEELYSKSSFLLALVQTNACSDSELLQNIVNAASFLSNEKVGSPRILSSVQLILGVLMPGTAVDSFRPGEVAFDAGEVIYKDSIKGRSDELIEFNKEMFEKCASVLYREKLAILNPLTDAQSLTDPNDPNYHSKVTAPGENYQEVRTNKILWKDLVIRFVDYIDRSLLMSRDLNISMKILELLCFYLVEGEKVSADLLIDRQRELNSYGVLFLIHRIIQRLHSGAFVKVTLKLGILMMQNGNRECQDAFVTYVKTNDSDGNWYNSVRKAFNSLQDWINLTLYDPDSESRVHDDISTSEQVKELTEGLHFMRFLWSLCTANNLNAQLILRDQSSFNRQSVDLLESINLLIEAIIPHRNAFRSIAIQHMEILIASIETLVALLIGPCPSNQSPFEKNKCFFLCKIILTSTVKNIDASIVTYLKCLVVKLLYSCLEGRFGTAMEESIISKIDLKVFDKVNIEFCQLLDQLKAGNIAIAESIKDNYSFECKAISKEVLDMTLRDLTSVRWRLALKQNVTNIDDSSSNIVRVEIFWINHTEVAYFPLPNEAAYLSETSKMNFLNTCDLSTSENRVKSLMDSIESFFDEMIVYKSLIQKFPLYSSIMTHYYPLKLSLFGLSLLVNIAVMLSFTQHSPDTSYFNDYSYSTSQIVLVLGLCILIGYSAILVYWILPAMPLRYRELSRLFTTDASTTRDWTAFNVLFGAIAFGIAVFIIHFYSLSNRNDEWALTWSYICIGITIFVPWFIYSYRRFIKIPISRLDFVISISIDLLSNSNILTTVIFAGATIGGLLNYVYLFSLLLLDFMLLSEQAMNVIRSVVRPWKSLASIFLCYCICICIFGFFGILLFNYSDFLSGDGLPCNSLTACMGLVFYGGLRTQDISNVMIPVGPNSSNPDPAFPTRMFFDLLFFIVLGVLLFNMVTGIIVDTFASLREETESREAILREETFISGLMIDDLEKAFTSFAQVQNLDQNVWNYVYYIYYLRNKDPFEYDGLESFVMQSIQHGNYSFFPKKTCTYSERNVMKNHTSKEDDLNNRLSALEYQMSKIEELLSSKA